MGSCGAWATAYTAMGLLENMDHAQGLWDNSFDGLPGGGGSAMYVYSQTCGGEDDGSYLSDDVAVETQQGDDEASDYRQGEADWWDLPTAQETVNARNWVLAAGSDIGTDRYSIEEAIANDEPVVLGIQATQAFENNASGSYPDPNDYSDDDYTSLGGHAVTVVGYDSGGVTVENSWGRYWDNGGYVHISWDWLEGTSQDSGEPDLDEAVAMVGMTDRAPAPTPTPTALPASPAPPVTNVTGADSNWHRSPVTLSFTATDSGGPGVSYTDYSLDGGAWIVGTSVTIPGPANHSDDGVHTIRYSSTDSAGSIEPIKSCEVKIDTLGPVCAAKNVAVKHDKACRLDFKVHDRLSPKVTSVVEITTRSGAVKRRWSWGYGQNFSGWWWTPYHCTLPRGRYLIHVYGEDLAGNAQSVVGKAYLHVK